MWELGCSLPDCWWTMSQLIWLNGEILPMAEARINVEDRGFQFADGLYEVIRVYAGRPFMLAEHLHRLENSCAGITLAMPVTLVELTREVEQFVNDSRLGDGMIYLQLTRGAAARNHAFPDCRPTLLFYVRPLPAV